MSDNIHSEGDIELELSQAAIPHATIAISEVDDDQRDDSTTPLTAGTQEANQDTNEGGQGEQPQEGDDIRDDAIGMEAQTLLNIQNEISRPTSVMGFWRMGGNLIVILYLIPITVALLTVTIVDWDSQCNRPLKHWTISQIIIQVLLTLNHAVILYKLPSSADTAEAVNERIRALAPYYLLKRILNLLWFSWFIVGMVWTFQALQEDTCPSSAPYLFRMCFALVVIQIFLTSLAVLFCCCSCLVLFLRVIANPVDLQGTAPRGASDTLIRALPVKRYRAGQTVKKEDSTCAICLSDYEDGEAIRFLPCNHHYHRNCVDKWLIINKACPFCKRNIDEQPNPPSTTTAATPETTTTTTTETTNEETNPSDSPSPSPTAAILNGDQESFV